MVTKTIIEDDNPLQILPDDELVIGEIPSALEDFMSENGIAKQTFQCQIKRRPAGGGMPQPLPGIYKDIYPSQEEIGKKWGPGTYVYSFSWRFTDADHKKKNKLKEHDIELGAEWEAINRKWMRKERILENKEVQKLKADAALDAALDGDPTPAANNGISNLKEAAHTLRDINSILTPGAGVPVAGNNDNEMFKLIMTTQAQSSDRMMTMMMGMMKQSNDMVIAMMGNKPASGGDSFKEAMEMVTNLVDLKAAIAPEKVTVLDKLLGAMEHVLPPIIEAAKKHGIKAAQANPMVDMTKNSQQFKDVMGDPQQWQYMVNQLIEKHGIEDCNIILGTMGVPLTVTEDGQIIPKMEKTETEKAAPQAEEPIVTPPPEKPEVHTGPPPGGVDDDNDDVIVE